MGAIVGMSGGFIVGLIGAFVLGPIWMIASEGGSGPPVDIISLALLVTIPAGLIVGIMVPIRKAVRRRQAANAEEEALRRQEAKEADRLRRHNDSQRGDRD
jgi:predicted lipid-binding transport protein (Tim44 family)